MDASLPIVTLQQRTLKRTLPFFTAPRSEEKSEPISFDDLEHLFLFVELVVGSSGLLYDGTTS